MNKMELRIWKEELESQKDHNVFLIKELTKRLERCNSRLTFMLDLKEQLQSPLRQNMEEEKNKFVQEIEDIKKENFDIDMLLFSIDVEIGNLFVCH